MNTLSSWRLALLAAIALSPFGVAQTAIAIPGSVVVPTLPSAGAGNWSNPSSGTSGNWSPGLPTRPTAPSVVVPVYPSGSWSTTPTTPPQTSFPPSRNPVVTQPEQSPIPTTRPAVRNPIVTRPTQAGGLIYRVVVMNASDMAQQQVRSVVPQAFRTSLNGQSVIQAGVFREQSKAVELQQLLNQNNVQASILSGQANDLPVNPPRVESPSNPDVTPLPAVPRNGRIVVIDPGHGGGDPGAIGIGGIRESDVVLDISRQVVSLLKQQGVEAVTTRTRDVEIELEPRVQFAERTNADVFVSIHANAFDARRTDVNGIETFFYSGGSGQPLARAVQDSLLQELGARDRGVKSANFYVIRYTSMPAILVETGFVTGSEDAARLASPAGRTRIARAIARGILQYLR